METSEALVATTVGATAGAAPEAVADATTTTIRTEPGADSQGSSTMPDSTPAPDALVTAAADDLARRLRVDSQQITVLKVTASVAADDALECVGGAESGDAPTALDTAQIVLESGGRVYVYRASAGGTPTLCSSGEKDGGRGFVPRPGYRE